MQSRHASKASKPSNTNVNYHAQNKIPPEEKCSDCQESSAENGVIKPTLDEEKRTGTLIPLDETPHAAKVKLFPKFKVSLTG